MFTLIYFNRLDFRLINAVLQNQKEDINKQP